MIASASGVADAQSLPVEDSAFDCAVSGLVLNFVPQHDRVISEMKRAVAADGIVAVYVWDYADKMEFMRYFWDAASALDPANSGLDEGSRFPICHPDALTNLFESVGLTEVSTTPIDIATHFKDFDDYWQPFLGAQGSAPSYVQTLTEAQRIALRDRLRATLPSAADGSISLIARAWAARGRK
ncbi:MAG: methyltransferase domain-containing protein [Anaerolineae bacterium]